MSNNTAAAGRSGAAAALIFLLAAACSDRAATSPEIPRLGAPLAAKNGPNALPTTGRIFFASGQTGNHELYSINPDGTDLRRLTYTTGNEDYPSVSNDGRKLVYLKSEPNSPQNIWTANTDGSRQRLLFSAPVGMAIQSARFSPDGRQIAVSFAEISTQKFRVGVMDANGGSLTVLTTGDDTGRLPSWSPDGLQLAFFGTTPGVDGTQVFTMNVDGTNRQQRTSIDPTTFGCCKFAEWSPDGSQILFATQEVSNGFDTQMYSLRTADWSTQFIGPPNLTLNPPAWSPDGTRILFKNATNLSWMYANGYGATPVISSQDPIGFSWSR
jgi:Tol biopolymer transport system component